MATSLSEIQTSSDGLWAVADTQPILTSGALTNQRSGKR